MAHPRRTLLNSSAPAAGNADIHSIWKRLIEAEFLVHARPKARKSAAARCPTCASPKDCNNHYCLQCKEGGLCPIVFRAEGKHHMHPWLQVRHYSQKYSVLAHDLEQLICKESTKSGTKSGTKYIKTYSLDGKNHCFLRARKPAMGLTTRNSHRGVKNCHACKVPIPKSTQASKEDLLVCSLECLIAVARLHPHRNLLKLKDGTMKHTIPPLLAVEKYNKNSRRRVASAPASVPAPAPAPATAEAPAPAPVLAPAPALAMAGLVSEISNTLGPLSMFSDFTSEEQMLEALDAVGIPRPRWPLDYWA